VVDSPVLSTRRSIRTTPKPHRLRKRITSALTFTAVAALMATVALPSYAFSEPEAVPVAAEQLETVSVEVSDSAPSAAISRDSFGATSTAELASARAEAAAAAAAAARRTQPVTYTASSAAAEGDDYPWRTAPIKTLSPLRYVYRECVDFVVWRLNRDVGSTSAPFAYDWGYLTPGNGNAAAWKGAWEKHGWPVSNTPKAGDIAYWANNHLAYVNAVNADGTVFLEEYNVIKYTYSTRTIPASQVDAFLSPPPR
jgi:surface antigen